MNKNRMKLAIRVVPLLIVVVVLFLSGCASTTAIETTNDSLTKLDEAAGQISSTVSKVAGLEATSPRLQAAVAGTLAQIYQEANPSVAHIQVVKQGTDLPFDHPQVPGLPDLQIPNETPQAFGEGSGFVWDKEGHIITNNHVIDGADKITVLFADDTSYPAEVIGADPDSDLAVLKIEAPADELRPVQMGDSSQVQVGDLAIAIGNPFGQEGTMTVGIISALGRLLPVGQNAAMAPHYNIPDIIQTDAAINPGNSGGVLLNDQGEVIGVTTAIISSVQASAGIGFAIPSAIVQNVVPVLINNGVYEHPYLGISGGTLTAEIAEAMGLDPEQRGVLVATVAEDGPAAQAGLKASDEQTTIDGFDMEIGGDIIVAIDGQPLTGIDDLIAYLERNTQVGQSVELTILRDGNQEQVSATLVARPQVDTSLVAQAQDEQGQEAANGEVTNRAWLGITIAPLNPEIATEMDLSSDQSGLIIQRVEPNSPAAKAGLKGGYMPLVMNNAVVMAGGDVITAVNGSEVAQPADLLAILSQYNPGDEVTLDLIRDGQNLQMTVTLGQQPG